MRRGNHPHKERLDKLKAFSGRPQERGRAFERLVAEVFRRAHYRVDRSSGAARPRQTDLLATAGNETLLVECKWRKRPAGSEDIDGLRTRTARLPGQPIGVLVSVGGFTKEALREVERRRDQPVLLFGEEELDEVTDRWGDLRHMLRIKQQTLLFDGRAHLLRGRSSRTPRTRRATFAFPEADTFLADNDGHLPWIVSSGGFGQFTFTCDRSLGWLSTEATVDVDIPLTSLSGPEDLPWALSELAALGWSTVEGQWCLQQQEANWHGIGPSTLVEALAERPTRYQNAGRIHHTEELTYYDVCEGGFYTLTADIDSRDGAVEHAQLSIQLAGVPLDHRDLDELCRTFDVLTPPYFRPRDRDDARRGTAVIRHQVDLKPVTLVLQRDLDDPRDPLWVCGVATANPLPDMELLGSDPLPPQLQETELLVCSVHHWHPLSQEHTYTLKRLQWTETGEATIVRVVCDWPDSEALAFGTGRAEGPSAPPTRGLTPRRHGTKAR